MVGFTLPFMFVFRPQLLMLNSTGGTAGVFKVALAVKLAILNIMPLAAAIAGYLLGPLSPLHQALLLISAGLSLYPAGPRVVAAWNLS